MKLINSKVELIEQQSGLEGVYKQIELAGRTCYKSEDKITPTSAKEFVDRMIKSGHGAMLEHGTIYLALYSAPRKPIDLIDKDKLTEEEEVKLNEYITYSSAWSFYDTNKYSKVKVIDSSKFITTNLRVLVENDRLDDLKYFEKTQFHEKRITARFTCDRGVSHEFVRHRVFSFAQESTRFCNYNKDKFNNEITFIIPCWSCTKTDVYSGVDNFDGDYFEHSLREAEFYYFKLLELGWKPQQARQVLPNALKTELVMTGFESDWKHFFDLRCAPSAHPDARKLALELKELIYGKQEK